MLLRWALRYRAIMAFLFVDVVSFKPLISQDWCKVRPAADHFSPWFENPKPARDGI